MGRRLVHSVDALPLILDTSKERLIQSAQWKENESPSVGKLISLTSGDDGARRQGKQCRHAGVQAASAILLSVSEERVV